MELGEGTLILPYIRRLRPFLGVQIVNMYIFVFFFFRKMIIFGGWVGGGV